MCHDSCNEFCLFVFFIHTVNFIPSSDFLFGNFFVTVLFPLSSQCYSCLSDPILIQNSSSHLCFMLFLSVTGCQSANHRIFPGIRVHDKALSLCVAFSKYWACNFCVLWWDVFRSLKTKTQAEIAVCYLKPLGIRTQGI